MLIRSVVFSLPRLRLIGLSEQRTRQHERIFLEIFRKPATRTLFHAYPPKRCKNKFLAAACKHSGAAELSVAGYWARLEK